MIERFDKDLPLFFNLTGVPSLLVTPEITSEKKGKNQKKKKK